MAKNDRPEEPPVHPDIHQSVVAQNRKLKEALKVNKNATVRHILEKMGVEPAMELIKLAQAEAEDGTPLLTNDQRIKIWSELLQYQQPKLKSVEHTGTVDQTVTIVVKKFDAPAEGMVIDLPDTRRLEAQVAHG